MQLHEVSLISTAPDLFVCLNWLFDETVSQVT
jgi:hypothetical protein